MVNVMILPQLIRLKTDEKEENNMKNVGQKFPDQMFYAGNITLGNAMKEQIDCAESLFKIQNVNFSLYSELEKRRKKYRQSEEYVDSLEKILKQNITNFRAESGICILNIQDQLSSLTSEFKQLSRTLKHLKSQINQNKIIIDGIKDKKHDLRALEFTTIQYDDELNGKQREMYGKVADFSDFELKTKIIWFSTEIDRFTSKINEISANLPNLESNQRMVILKTEKKINLINEIQIEIKNIPDLSKFSASKRAEISKLQRKTDKILNIVHQYQDVQSSLVSKVSVLMTKFIKTDIFLKKNLLFLSKIKNEKDITSLNEHFQNIIDEDDEEIRARMKTKYEEKMSNMNENIKKQTIFLQKKIYEKKKLINNHKNNCKEFTYQINNYREQRKQLSNLLNQLNNESNKLDQKLVKINQKINAINKTLEKDHEGKHINKKSSYQEELPIVEHFNRNPNFERINDEEETHSKIILIQNQISKLNDQIHQKINYNTDLSKRIERNIGKLAIIKNKANAIKDYSHQNPNNKYFYYATENAVCKLACMNDNLLIQIKERKERILKKKTRVQSKRLLFGNIEAGLENDLKYYVKKNNNFSYCKEYNRKKLREELRFWILGVEKEIIQWENIQRSDSFDYYLKKWNDKLIDAEIEDSSSSISCF